MQPGTPSENEPTATPPEVGANSEKLPEAASEARKVSVSLSAEEFALLDDLGHASEQVQQWMADHGVAEGDLLDVTIDGKPAGLFVTDSADFFTRDRKASEEQAAQEAASARAVLGIEELVDAHSQEIADKIVAGAEHQLPIEDIMKVGEEGVESAERLAAIHDQIVTDFDTELRAEVQFATDSLVEAGEELQRCGSQIEASITSSIAPLNKLVRNLNQYPIQAVQTMLREAIDGLEGSIGTARNYRENGIGETVRVVSGIVAEFQARRQQAEKIDDDFQSELSDGGSSLPEGVQGRSAKAIFEVTAADAEGSTNELKLELQALDAATTALITRGLGQNLGHLKVILENSYRHTININEVAQVLEGIKRSVKSDSPFGQAIGKVQKTLSR